MRCGSVMVPSRNGLLSLLAPYFVALSFVVLSIVVLSLATLPLNSAHMLAGETLRA